MTTMVYQYGLLAPIEEAAHVREQMLRAHRYKNKLVEIERARRTRSREAERTAGDVVALAVVKEEAEQLVRQLVAEVKAARTSTRSRSESAELRARLAAARQSCKLARAAWGEARRLAREDEGIIAARKKLYEQVALQKRAARAENGLHWGTGAIVDEAIEAASKIPLYLRGEPSDPSFKRWAGEGSVGVQVHQKGAAKTGLTVGEVMGRRGDAAGWLFIDPPGARGWTRLHVRLGTCEDGSPLMAVWPMIMHRSLPPGSLVKRVSVRVRKVGPREVWTCALTVAFTGHLKEPAASSRTVAVEIGWKQLDGGLRVATWIGEDGLAGELLLSPSELSAHAKADELRSTRDDNFNDARARLVDSLRGLRDVPEALLSMTTERGGNRPSKGQALARLAAWRSPARLAALCRRWRESSVEVDARGAFEALEAWRYHDHHLWAWESSQRRKSVLRRREVYRVFAARLAREYARVVVSDADYKELSQRHEASHAVTIDAAALNRKIASPGIFRDVLCQAFASRGGEVAKAPSRGLSTTCPACGSVDERQRDHTHVCTRCPEHGRDVDQVACLNMLRGVGLGARVDEIVERGRRAGARARRTLVDCARAG